jgi:hypothetical protein
MAAFDPVTAVTNVVGQVIDRVWPDPAQAAAAKLQLMQLQQTGDLAAITGQMDINKVEAGNESIFVSGGRPFIIWVCGMAFAWNWIGLPVAKLAMAVFGHPIVMQAADMSEMMPVLMGLLGLGGMRTWEKIQTKKINSSN